MDESNFMKLIKGDSSGRMVDMACCVSRGVSQRTVRARLARHRSAILMEHALKFRAARAMAIVTLCVFNGV